MYFYYRGTMSLIYFEPLCMRYILKKINHNRFKWNDDGRVSFICLLSFSLFKSPHDIASLIDNSHYMHWFQHFNIFCDPFINIHTLPLSSRLYFSTSTLLLQSFGWRQPIISKGGEKQPLMYHVCVLALYLILQGNITFHDYKVYDIITSSI